MVLGHYPKAHVAVLVPLYRLIIGSSRSLFLSAERNESRQGADW